jgi:hypothetical protein
MNARGYKANNMSPESVHWYTIWICVAIMDPMTAEFWLALAAVQPEGQGVTFKF